MTIYNGFGKQVVFIFKLGFFSHIGGFNACNLAFAAMNSWRLLFFDFFVRYNDWVF